MRLAQDPNRSDCHASAGAGTVPKLTLQLDHSMGADHYLRYRDIAPRTLDPLLIIQSQASLRVAYRR